MAMIFCLSTSHAQEYGLRIYTGTMHYLGDLSPAAHRFSVSDGNFSGGVAYTYQSNEMVTYFIKYFRGKISGDDAQTTDPFRRQRNLHFESNIDEIGLGFEINLFSGSPEIMKYGLDVFLTAGINVFHFNPKARYQDQWVELQPLGTEGQGAEGFYKSPYKLWQLSFPMGIGTSFKLSEFVSLGIEFVPRMTLTDYLDDVSSSYIATDLQNELQGELTSALANRQGEYLYGPDAGIVEPVFTGQQRGDKFDRDWYMFSSITLGSKIGALQKIKKQRREFK